ncbi:MAG: diacylglycerol kinase family protein [Patescibacteria group bacterium]|jgi:diacylglycerol kinase
MSQNHLKNGSFLKSLVCATRGLVFGMKERNTKIQLTSFIVAAFLGVLFDISKIEWLVVFAVSASVFALELVNTAIEEICDKLRDDLGLSYESTRKARDVAAGGVLLAALAALSCGVVIFFPRIFVVLYRMFL